MTTTRTATESQTASTADVYTLILKLPPSKETPPSPAASEEKTDVNLEQKNPASTTNDQRIFGYEALYRYIREQAEKDGKPIEPVFVSNRRCGR